MKCDICGGPHTTYQCLKHVERDVEDWTPELAVAITQRDTARREAEELRAQLALANHAIEMVDKERTRILAERDELRQQLKDREKHLRDANRGAKINAHVSQGLADKLIEARQSLLASEAAREKMQYQLEYCRDRFLHMIEVWDNRPDEDMRGTWGYLETVKSIKEWLPEIIKTLNQPPSLALREHDERIMAELWKELEERLVIKHAAFDKQFQQENNKLRSQLQQRDREVAALRNKLEQFTDSSMMVLAHKHPWGIQYGLLARIEEAQAVLTSTTTPDYIPRSSVKPLVEALEKIIDSPYLETNKYGSKNDVGALRDIARTALARYRKEA